MRETQHKFLGYSSNKSSFVCSASTTHPDLNSIK
jgi:hypothetical protein